ncbi:MAG: Flp pilus assembly protein CpaB [Cyanobacteria bacterium P01_H01_bin.74]
MQALVALAIALVVGVIALFLGFRIISSVNSQASKQKLEVEAEKKRLAEEEARLKEEERLLATKKKITSYSVVYTRSNLMPGEAIVPSLVELKKTEEKPDRMVFQKVSDVLGMVAKLPILAGEPLERNKLMDTGSYFSVPEGTRALSLLMTSIASIDSALVPGVRVDVLVTFSTPQWGKVTQTVLQNVQVIAVSQAGAKGRDGEALKKITVSVTPEQAEKLILASNIGSFHLTLRNVRDKTLAKLPGTDLNKLLLKGNGASPMIQKETVPPKAPDVLALPTPEKEKAEYRITIFKGTGSETVGFYQ